MHTDSAEELLIIVQGTAEARVGDEVGRLETHQVGLVPPMAPHGLRNIGDDVLRVLGTFSASTVVSTFERRLPTLADHRRVICEAVGCLAKNMLESGNRTARFSLVRSTSAKRPKP